MNNQQHIISLFCWRGIKKNGIRITGTYCVYNIDELKVILQEKCITLCSAYKIIFATSFTYQQLSFFLDQLLSLLHAGIPILKVLDIIQRNEKSKQVTARIKHIKYKLKSGKKLSDCLAPHVAGKEKVTINMLFIGEKSGCLLEVMQYLVEQRNGERKIRTQLVRAASYPLFLSIISIGIMMVLTTWVVPEFQRTYENMGATLPIYTMVTIRLSEFLAIYAPIILAGIVLCIFLIHYLKQSIPNIAWIYSSIQMSTPILSTILNAYFSRHFASNLRIMYISGAPLAKSINWLISANINPLYCAALGSIHNDIQRGSSLQKAIKNSHFFPNLLEQIVEIGEQSGNLENSLKKIENHYDEYLKTISLHLIQLLEPCLIIFIAICVAWVVITMYMPIFNLGFAL